MMPLDNGQQLEELNQLMEALCENYLTQSQAQRLEQLVRDDPRLLKYYLNYISLHGNLHWDTALASEVLVPEKPYHTSAANAARKTVFAISAALVACLLIAAVFIFDGLWNNDPVDPIRNIADGMTTPAEIERSNRPLGHQPGASRLVERNSDSLPDHMLLQKPSPSVPGREDDQPKHVANENSTNLVDKQPIENDPSTGASDEVVVAFIDEQISQSIDEAGIQSSPLADDSEWLRRTCLDISGRIPPIDVVEDFLADTSPNKRRKLVDHLLDDPSYVRNFTTVWTNLLIGQSDSNQVNRAALQKFLHRSFAQNRSWSEMVHDMIAAEGDVEKNGAANFLVAHLNNQAVPATAITARVFLGTQMQCTQCHDHPFNDWKQNQFWEFNSFFAQTETRRFDKVDPETKRRVRSTRLVNEAEGGPVYYENRKGEMNVAFPIYGSHEISEDADVNRRQELARLMLRDEDRQVARAMVNRTWSHFFGYGFTSPVDDMGPHNPPTHPDLLERLTAEFVHNGYDHKQLIRWIVHSQPYQLSSRFNTTNQHDNPAFGYSPLFSRMYVKQMTAEQLYDSVMVATRAKDDSDVDWYRAERDRHRWLQQFVQSYETEENDEASTFNGTITQALMLMNGELTDEALDVSGETYLRELITERSPLKTKVEKIALAALGRQPTQRELVAVTSVIQQMQATNPTERQKAIAIGLQDLFWAFLNSNEFVHIY